MRFLPGYYNQRRSHRPALVRDGIADVHLSDDDLDASERAILAELSRLNGRKRGRLQSAMGEAVPQFNAVLEHLERRGLLNVDLRSDRVYLKPEALVCSLVGPEHPIGWQPGRGRFYSALDQQVGIAPTDLQPFAIHHKDRADFAHPNFCRTACRINYYITTSSEIEALK